MICDLAETYHITDYKSLPPSVVAILVAGLRDDSRLVMKKNGAKAPDNIYMLAIIADRLGVIHASLTGGDTPKSLMDMIDGIEEQEEERVYETFDSPEDFIKVRYGGNR